MKDIVLCGSYWWIIYRDHENTYRHACTHTKNIDLTAGNHWHLCYRKSSMQVSKCLIFARKIKNRNEKIFNLYWFENKH